MADEEWQVECFLSREGTRYCFKTRGALAQMPRMLLDQIVEREGMTPTAAPGEESEEARGPNTLERPAILSRHEHSWRKTSGTHNGYPVFQCRVCEDTAIEGVMQ